MANIFSKFFRPTATPASRPLDTVPVTPMSNPTLATPLAPEIKSGFDALTYSYYRGTTGQIYALQNMSMQEVIRGYDTIAPIYTGVSRLANGVSSLPIKLVDIDTLEEVPEHPASVLLSSPNTETLKTRSELLRDMTIWRVLAGEVYLTLTGRPNKTPLEIYLQRPDLVTIEAGQSGFAAKIRVNTTGNVPLPPFIKDDKTGIFISVSNLQQIYLIQNFNAEYSASDLRGKSELSALYQEINHYVHATQHNRALLQNGARPTGAFIVKNAAGAPVVMSEESFLRLQQQIKEDYTGAANAGKPLLLEGGLEWVPMEMTPRDLDFANMKDQSEEGVYSALGVPPQLIKSIKTTANNLVNVRREFYENRILPLGDSFCDHLNNAILRRDSANLSANGRLKYKFIVDRDEIDVLVDETATRRKSIENSTIMTINEKRKIYKLPPIEGGDKIVDPNGRPIAGPDAPAVVGQVAGGLSDNPDVAGNGVAAAPAKAPAPIA